MIRKKRMETIMDIMESSGDSGFEEELIEIHNELLGEGYTSEQVAVMMKNIVDDIENDPDLIEFERRLDKLLEKIDGDEESGKSS